MAQTKLDSPLAQARLKQGAGRKLSCCVLLFIVRGARRQNCSIAIRVRAQWAQAFAALRDSALRMAESTKVAESSKIGPTASASDYSNHARPG